MTARINLKINQGETFKHTFKWEDENGVAINITGWSGRMHIRDKIASAAPLVKLSTDLNDITRNGDIVLDGINGVIELKIPHTFTETLVWPGNDGVYDLELIDLSGDVTRFVEGKVTVSPEVTRG